MSISSLNALLDQSIQRHPQRTALVATADDAGSPERRYSFSELGKLVLQAASAFRARGIGAGERVAILHRNGPGFVVAYFGLARLGAVAVPLNFMIRKPDELAYMLGHCKAKGLVTETEFIASAAKARAALPGLASVWVTDKREGLPEGTEGFWPFVEGHAPLSEADGVAPVRAEDPACVLYTSGTTGMPKGVVLTHGNLTSNVEACIEAMALKDKDAMLCILPMFHTFAWTVCVLIPLRLGVRTVTARSVVPARPWLSMMARHRVSLFVAVPQIYSVLAKQASGLAGLVLRYWFFRKVRLCVSGAGPLPAQTAADFRRAFGRPILEGYGLTETSPVATINRSGLEPSGVGAPLPGVVVRVCDEAGRDAPTGAEGEVWVRGPNVMKGYLDDPKATSEVLTPDGWLKTGDVGALGPDGRLQIRDRMKDMIIVKGLKVFSAQVEAVLCGHPAVAEAAVIGLPAADGDETIKAFVVLNDGAAATKAELLQFCREKLDAYKRPRDLEIVPELPKNALQKVLKRVLRARAAGTA
ncbi:MAG TPA: AMP-binding protein [Elusimicrobiota bacterium]|nr:AMP-binding protein [Elusimicrobiota bacterium]